MHVMDSTDSGHAYTDEPSFFDANLMLSTSSDAYDAYAPLLVTLLELVLGRFRKKGQH